MKDLLSVRICSVSIRVQTEDVYPHPDLTFNFGRSSKRTAITLKKLDVLNIIILWTQTCPFGRWLKPCLYSNCLGALQAGCSNELATMCMSFGAFSGWVLF